MRNGKTVKQSVSLSRKTTSGLQGGVTKFNQKAAKTGGVQSSIPDDVMTEHSEYRDVPISSM